MLFRSVSQSRYTEYHILRHYLDLIKATLHTNFFQTNANGTTKSYFNFKLNPHLIPEIPQPIPKFEIFIYNPHIENVHLHFNNVTHNSLHWSNREEDFRTEMLGLIKAQQVKNTVIVPMGTKNNFVPRKMPIGGSHDEVMTKNITYYRIFINDLLDITNNLKNNKIVPPQNVVHHDADDPYLIITTNKDTTTFSNITNAIVTGKQIGRAHV